MKILTYIITACPIRLSVLLGGVSVSSFITVVLYIYLLSLIIKIRGFIYIYCYNYSSTLRTVDTSSRLSQHKQISHLQDSYELALSSKLLHHVKIMK